MKKDMTRVLVESAVRRTLKNISESPERATRNLIDLGLQFSSGRFQTRLLSQAQKMLQNQNSAYYELVKNIVATVDHSILTTFGVNLGYNSCTKGAQIIREIEEKNGYNIPWALNLVIDEQRLGTMPDFYPSVLRQGRALGIHTYLLFVTGSAENLLSILKRESDCAFVLFLRGSQIGSTFLDEMKTVKNVMISVYVDQDMPTACQRLLDNRMLYDVYNFYTEQDKQSVISGGLIKHQH